MVGDDLGKQVAAGFYLKILWRFDIRTKFLYGMAEEAKIESAEATDKMCAVSHARMYLENFIQNTKSYFL